ncbi:hypothetical protein [Enterobacter kobei]|uniref:hypothetical protein n=1 Tax=Enterobacter kobei TaxID=208224 RepID=UPI002FD1BF10
MQITKEQAQKIIDAADEVITALAGTNEDVHPESDSMLRLWDDLNDRHAPPEVVRELARIAMASLEAEPVADVVAWSSPNEERACDVRLRRHNINPGPLYTVPPASVAFNTEPVAWLWSNRKHPPEVTLVCPENDDKAEAAQWSGWSYQALYAFPPVPEGWIMVPVEPTEDMIIHGFEAELREEFRDAEAWEAFEEMSGCEQAAQRAKWCWSAMIAAAPKPLPSTSSKE